MPEAKRIVPTPINRARPVDRGRIIDRAVAVESYARPPLKILMYGPNRVGKTTLACQGPKPLLLLSCEPAVSGGFSSVRKEKGVDVLKYQDQFKTTAELVQIGVELANDTHYKAVVIDSVTALQDIVLAELLGLPAVPDQLGWGTVTPDQYRERSEKTKRVLRSFVDVCKDTVFLSKEKDHNPPKEEKVNAKTGKAQPDMRPKFLRGVSNESFIAADLGGATAGWLQDACDCVCRLFIEEEVRTQEVEINKQKRIITETTGKYIRYLRMQYHPNYAAGVRSADPSKVPEVMPLPSWEKIVAVLA